MFALLNLGLIYFWNPLPAALLIYLALHMPFALQRVLLISFGNVRKTSNLAMAPVGSFLPSSYGN